MALNQCCTKVTSIAYIVDCSISTVYKWTSDANTIDFNDKLRSGRPCVYTEETALKIIAFYCQSTPFPGCGRWTLRVAEKHLKANPDRLRINPGKSTIHRILKGNNLKPHLSRYFLHITDPDFFPKMEHLLELYKNPPRHLFFFDECPGIQILKRITPDLRTETMKKRLEEFEYIRNGTMDVFAFLNHSDGTVYAQCRGNHTMLTFGQVFRRHVAQFPETEVLHYVMDNLATHNGYPFCLLVAELSGIKCPSEKILNTRSKRMEWLKSPEKRIVIHYTPFHGSWLNLIEIWFGIMGKKVLSESFGSPEELKSAFDSFVTQWNLLLAHPFRWNYTGEGLHEKAVSRFTKMLKSSASSMNIRFLTKSLLLMSNILNNYFSKVSKTVWQDFNDVFWTRFRILSDIILREQGPRKGNNAIQAMETLTTTIGLFLHETQIAAG